MNWRDNTDDEPRGGALGFLLGLAMSLTLAFGLMALGGFFSFIDLISDDAPLANRSDAIVVLTGGDDRIETGMTLLSGGFGQRLLISGVNSEVSREDLRKIIAPADKGKFDCCVDLDKSAQNTIGNASETALWAKENGYGSLIIVTANYHMPRALAELRQVAPALQVTPYPVAPKDLHIDDWWRWPGSAKLLGSEYVKFLATQFRFRLESL